MPVLEVEPPAVAAALASSLERRPPLRELAHGHLPAATAALVSRSVAAAGPAAAVDDGRDSARARRRGEGQRQRQAPPVPARPLLRGPPRARRPSDDDGDPGLHEPGDEGVVGEAGGVGDGEGWAPEPAAAPGTFPLPFVRRPLLFFPEH